MQVPIGELRPYLHSFDFQSLFVEGLGWNFYRAEPTRIQVNDHKYVLGPVAEKAGFAVYVCNPNADGGIPDYPVRRKIELQIAKIAFEHLIIFIDADKTVQVWQWVKREAGKPAACREHTVYTTQTGTPLLQRLNNFLFTLEDESKGIVVTDVAAAVGKALDVEKVTKRFYDRFRTELAAFQGFIDGIAAQGDLEWYASLMLNRMMFVYFVQKQGFLDGDFDYLRHRLEWVRRQEGSGKFQQFYRIFLLRLFHEGLGQPESERAQELAELLGQVPFLNGGLFDVHDLERDNPDISIPDEAFQRIFDFFDDYRWHLDERPRREDNEINPDVLGYIFEKYINQKQMGAYYTKEDITGYITRNTVIPFLFDAAKKTCPAAFAPGGSVWRLLKENPDRYIYPAAGHGMAWRYSPDADPVRLEEPLQLPDDIAAGLCDMSQRSGWNRPAPTEYALPTETWRKLVARRRRYKEVEDKLAAGEVSEINDLVTLNLDVERFSKDVIVQSKRPEMLRAFWKAISSVSVLDPTCGSGAFLFAALNILEPLYTACLERMRGFLGDEERIASRDPNYLGDFKDVLEQADKHHSKRYFILKSIVLNNLYGVDIMEEAVEICKLRLFLKLMAQLKSSDQIEPLPDIDFNIRPGNTLVGFTSENDVYDAILYANERDAGQRKVVLLEDEEKALQQIKKKAKAANLAFNKFRKKQTVSGGGGTAADKADLRSRLDNLRGELDHCLAVEYGVRASNISTYKLWKANHQPFHWFIEFYEIMSKGGFDVVVGNPPYVATKNVKKSYMVKGFRTNRCPDIYSMIVERATDICRVNGRTSMIVPLSLVFSEDFAILRTYLYEQCSYIWFSSFGRIPSALFSFDTRVRNTIYLAKRSSEGSRGYLTTRLHRWFESERPTLFNSLSYCQFSPVLFDGLVPKIGNARVLQGFEALLSGNYRLGTEFLTLNNGLPLHFKQTAYNWLTFCIDQPPVLTPDGTALPQTQYGTVRFLDEENRDLSLLLTNGLLMFMWWIAIGDDFHLTQKGFASAPFGPKQLTKRQQLRLLRTVPKLTTAMSENVVFKLNAGKNIGNYNLTRCRHITNEADKIWLKALGLNDLWDDIELEHLLVVRTAYEDE